MCQELSRFKIKLIFILMTIAFVMPYPLENEPSQIDESTSDVITHLRRMELRQKRMIRILKSIEYLILTMDEQESALPPLEYEKPEIVNKRKMNVNQKEMAISNILNKIKSNG